MFRLPFYFFAMSFSQAYFTCWIVQVGPGRTRMDLDGPWQTRMDLDGPRQTGMEQILKVGFTKDDFGFT